MTEQDKRTQFLIWQSVFSRKQGRCLAGKSPALSGGGARQREIRISEDTVCDRRDEPHLVVPIRVFFFCNVNRDNSN